MVMKLLSLALVLSACTTACLAHISIWSVWVNGVDQGGPAKSVYVRGAPYESNNPVRNVSLSYIACHSQNRVLPKWIDVKAGDKLAFEWYWEKRNFTYTHKGPLFVDMAPADVDVNAPNAWTKLFQEGYKDGSWPDQKFLGGNLPRPHHEIIVPDVPAGKYLVRGEHVGLQEANLGPGLSQHFPACVQVRVTSNGNVKLPGGTSFPGSWDPQKLIWSINDQGIDQATFPMPEPAVWSESPGGQVYRVEP